MRVEIFGIFIVGGKEGGGGEGEIEDGRDLKRWVAEGF